MSAGVWAELAVCLAALALTLLISRRLLHGRHAVPVGALVLFALSWWDLRLTDIVATEGMLSLVTGWADIVKDTALPLAAAGWLLRDRSARPAMDRVTSELLGSWEAGAGTLHFEPDGIFTLTRAGAATTAGLWEPGVGVRPQVVLKVDASTDLGHGWQATVLDLAVGPHGAVLRATGGEVGSAAAVEYRRHEAEAALEISPSYIGTLELLES
jgi:hypothetical protein